MRKYIKIIIVLFVIFFSGFVYGQSFPTLEESMDNNSNIIDRETENSPALKAAELPSGSANIQDSPNTPVQQLDLTEGPDAFNPGNSEDPDGFNPGPSSSDAGTIPNPLKGNITDIAGFLRVILNTIVLPIGGMICVFFIIYAGFLFVTAQGNEDKLKDAKSAIFNAIIGTAILLASVAIMTLIEATLKSIVA